MKHPAAQQQGLLDAWWAPVLKSSFLAGLKLDSTAAQLQQVTREQFKATAAESAPGEATHVLFIGLFHVSCQLIAVLLA